MSEVWYEVNVKHLIKQTNADGQEYWQHIHTYTCGLPGWTLEECIAKADAREAEIRARWPLDEIKFERWTAVHGAKK